MYPITSGNKKQGFVLTVHSRHANDWPLRGSWITPFQCAYKGGLFRIILSLDIDLLLVVHGDRNKHNGCTQHAGCEKKLIACSSQLAASVVILYYKIDQGGEQVAE